jgi:hypothetical protein
MPLTPDEERILAAWQDPSPQPWYHEMVKARLYDQWPALAAAIRILELRTTTTEETSNAA